MAPNPKILGGTPARSEGQESSERKDSARVETSSDLSGPAGALAMNTETNSRVVIRARPTPRVAHLGHSLVGKEKKKTTST